MNDSERFERYLDDFGDQLAQTGAARPRPHPHPHRRGYVFATAVALATITVTALLLGASGEQVDPIAEARAALAPPGEIVYMKVTTVTISPGSGSAPPPQTSEQWSATEPKRWRYVSHVNRAKGALHPFIGGRGVPPITRQEFSYGAGIVRNYFVGPETYMVVRGYGDDDPAARIPSGLGLGSGDVGADLGSMLVQGTVTDRGEQQLAGRTVRRFVVERIRGTTGVRSNAARLVYDVDPQTFAPVEGRLSFGGTPARPTVTSRMRVVAYERIPLNATTAQLLRIHVPPGTKPSRDTLEKLRARDRAWRAKCRPIQQGRALACPPPPGLMATKP